MQLHHVPLLCCLSAAALAQRVEETSAFHADPASAQGIGIGEHIAGRLDGALEHDFYRIVLSGPADLRVWTGPGYQVGARDTVLTLYDGRQQRIVAVDDGNVTTHGFYSVLTLGGLAPGVYYIEVAAGSGWQAGAYTLDVVVAPVGTYVTSVNLTQIFETPEPNDPRLVGGVSSLTALDSQNRGVIVAGRGGGGPSWDPVNVGPEDYDCFRFTLDRPGIVTLKTLAATTAPSVRDTMLHLVDAATMQRIAFDDNGGANDFSCIVEFLHPGQYYAVVNTAAPGDDGAYRLNIESVHMVPPSVRANAIINLGGCGNPAPHLGTREAEGWPGVHPEQPVLGSTFVADLTDVRPGAHVAVVVDLVAQGPTLLQGTNCHYELNQTTAARNLQVASANGDLFWALPMPLQTNFAGLPLEMQVAVFDVQANAVGVLVSNRLSLICGIGH